MTIERLRDALSQLGPPVTALELAEMIWLAGYLPAGAAVSAQAGAVGTETAPQPDHRLEPPAGHHERPETRPGTARAREPRQPLYAPDTSPAGDTGHYSDALPVPTAPMLGHALAIQRALRPLRRRVPARARRVLDEAATAAQIAGHPGQHPWVPVMTAAQERWLSLALVVDTGPSMAMWQPLVGELREMMFRLGAFRDVRVWLLSDVADRIGVRASVGGPVLAPPAIVDPTGRQALLMLSDCSGPHWWDGRAGAAVRLWAAHGPAAIVQPLGERLWHRTATAVTPGRAILARPGAPNTELRFTPHGGRMRIPRRALPVPVTELSAEWLADWARLVAGAAGPRDTSITYLGGEAAPAAAAVMAEQELPVVEQVHRFQSAASPEAAELAAHVAVAVPFLPVMRLIQQRILRDPRPSYLAEILLSGLLKPSGTVRGLYEFEPGAPTALLETLPRAEPLTTVRVLEQISAEIQARAGTMASTFQAAMSAAGGTGSLSAMAGQRPFALVNAEALRLLRPHAIPGVLDEQAAHETAATAEPPIEVSLGDEVTGRPVTLPLPGVIPEGAWGLPGAGALPAPGKELNAILEALDPAAPERLVAVYGLGGSGKTRLAEQAARAAVARGWFPGGVLYTSLRGRGDINEVLGELLRTLGVPDGHLPLGAERKSSLYHAVLAGHAEHGQPILMVIDDVGLDSQISALTPVAGGARAIVTSRYRLDLAGARSVRLPSARQVWQPAPELPPGPRLALVIGTSQYADSGLDRLPSPGCGAVDLAALLKEPDIGGFKVTALVDRTEASVRGALDAFLRSRGPDDLVLLYVSCHAVVDRQGHMYLAAADTVMDQPARTGIKVAELREWLGECQARRQVVILDCTFGAWFTDPRCRDYTTSQDLPRALTGPGRVVLTGSGGYDFSYDGTRLTETPQSWFTASLTEGLRTGAADADADGLITLDEAFDHAGRQVRAVSPDQAPRRWGPGAVSETVLARSPAGRLAVPAPLPEDTTGDLMNRYPAVRRAAVAALAPWLADADPARALAAETALRDVAANDTGGIAGTAWSLLDRAGRTGALRPRVAPSVPWPVPASTPPWNPSGRLDNPHGAVTALAFSPDGHMLADGAASGMVQVWDPATRVRLATFQAGNGEVTALAFSPDGQLLVAGTHDGVRAWDPRTEVADGRFAVSGGVTALAFRPDGRQLAGATDEGVIHVRDPDGARAAEFQADLGAVTALAFSPGSRQLAIGARDGVRMWTPADSVRMSWPATDGVAITAVMFDLDGRLFVGGTRGKQGVVVVWDRAIGSTHYTLVTDRGGPVIAVAFGPDGRYMGMARQDGAIQVWDPANGTHLRTLRGRESAAGVMAFGPAGDMLAAGGADAAVHLWG